VEHRGQFLLAEPGVFPNFEFARALRNELFGDDGTVLMWSHHEHTILNRIAAQIDESNEPPQDAQALRAFVLSLTRTGDRPMYDLCALAKAAFFHVATKGSVSIKKVLPAMLSTSDWLRQHYAQPIYGAADGMTSSNFKDTVWCPKDMSGASACDPYALLRDFGTDLMGDAVLPGPDPDEMVIAEGGAAAMAYARLQFETLQPQVRLQIQQALLRYCELDTLAMVMVVQGWQRVVFDENQ
jgi:hypothetical protein